jgi:hypothetical protein
MLSGLKPRNDFLSYDEYPSAFWLDLPIIVVGAVDNDGQRTEYSQGKKYELSVSAPGNVICAGFEGPRFVTGTSVGKFLQPFSTLFSYPIHLITSKIATPAVAGLAAYLLSLETYKSRLQVSGEVAVRVKQLIEELAYPRVSGGYSVAFNGVNQQGDSCASGSGTKDKRQELSAGTPCSSSSVAPSSSTNVLVSEASSTSTTTSATGPSASLVCGICGHVSTH